MNSLLGQPARQSALSNWTLPIRWASYAKNFFNTGLHNRFDKETFGLDYTLQAKNRKCPGISSRCEPKPGRIGDLEDHGQPHSSAHLGEHVHVPDELAGPWARCTERAAGVAASVAAGGVAAVEADAHSGGVDEGVAQEEEEEKGGGTHGGLVGG